MTMNQCVANGIKQCGNGRACSGRPLWWEENSSSLHLPHGSPLSSLGSGQEAEVGYVYNNICYGLRRHMEVEGIYICISYQGSGRTNDSPIQPSNGPMAQCVAMWQPALSQPPVYIIIMDNNNNNNNNK